MPKLIAQKAFRYAEIPLESGTEFYASERDAKILVFARNAIRVKDEAKPRSKRKYQRRDMVAQ